MTERVLRRPDLRLVADDSIAAAAGGLSAAWNPCRWCSRRAAAGHEPRRACELGGISLISAVSYVRRCQTPLAPAR